MMTSLLISKLARLGASVAAACAARAQLTPRLDALGAMGKATQSPLAK